MPDEYDEDDEKEEAADVGGSAEPGPLGDLLGSGTRPKSLKSRAVHCCSCWLGMLLSSCTFAHELAVGG